MGNYGDDFRSRIPIGWKFLEHFLMLERYWRKKAEIAAVFPGTTIACFFKVTGSAQHIARDSFPPDSMGVGQR